jgi:hypothetical protein
MTKIIKLAGTGLILVLVGIFFSYRLLNTPLGLTADEAGFGTNAVYLSRTLHDETGVFLPVFALSLGGKEWRQPVTQYYIAAFFKIFGASVYKLRLSTIPITLLCAILTYLLAREFWNWKWSIFSAAIFLTIPLVMIQTHMALDNIMPVPFTLLWLLLLAKHAKVPKLKYVFWAGVSLGIGFYTYKGMRATVPIWCVLTVIYLAWRQKYKDILIFTLGTAPFFLAIPFLEFRYPGAVFDNKGFTWSSWYDFLLPYLSSFDLAFLFIQGDATPWHSTGKHGMMLLATLPLFVVGLYQSARKKDFSWFILAVFFSAPLLYGFVDSVHRASRLMSMIPAYVIIATIGARAIWAHKKMFLLLVVILMLLNYSDFVNFYWYKYPELTRQWFGDLSPYKDFETFAREAKTLKLDPYVEMDLANGEGPSGQFYQVTYLGDNVRYLAPNDQLPPGGILFSVRDSIPGLQKLSVPTVQYKIQVLK